MTNGMRTATAVIALCISAAAAAREVPGAASDAGDVAADHGVTAYPAGFFTETGAVNALDMVRYVPGFAFQDADGSRGYAGAGGNVLIDGRRPSTKTTRLRTVLQQIPIQAVERIEVVRGSTPGIDMQGQSVVANVIRREGVSDIGALQGMAKFFPSGDVGVIGRVEKSRRSGPYLLEGWFEARRDRPDSKVGEGAFARHDASGALVESGDYLADGWARRLRSLGTVEREFDAALLRANLALTHERDDDSEVSSTRDAAGDVADDVVEEQSRESRLEAGLDYDGPLGGHTGIQLVALQTLSRESDDSTRIQPGREEAAAEERRSGESILRGLLRRELRPGLNVEAGAEGAFNFLDATARLTEDGQVVDLPSADVRVEELRGELFSTLMWQPLAGLSLELGLRGETSTISVSGQVDTGNDFRFFKPRLVAAYALEGGRQFSARIEREVGQLDFEDFAAGSELADGTVDAGNPDLEPERAWVYEASWVQPVPGDGAVTLTYRYFELEEVIDLVPVGGFAAPGNIGDGTRRELDASVSLGLDSIGPGLGRLQFTGTWRDSEVVDPVTGASRGISDEPDFEGEVLYTRDFPSLNGTFTARGELTAEETSYRLDQVIARRTGNEWRVGWDWRARQDLQLRVELQNLTSRKRWRNRVRYDGLRSSGVVESRDSRSSTFDPLLMLRVRWTF